MAETTEIYICKRGQALKQGRLEVSDHIHTKQDAQADAKRKCELDKRVHKVAYYRINEEGDSKIFYSYTNPAEEEAVGGDGKSVNKNAADASRGNGKVKKKKKRAAKSGDSWGEAFTDMGKSKWLYLSLLFLLLGGGGGGVMYYISQQEPSKQMEKSDKTLQKTMGNKNPGKDARLSMGTSLEGTSAGNRGDSSRPSGYGGGASGGDGFDASVGGGFIGEGYDRGSAPYASTADVAKQYDFTDEVRQKNSKMGAEPEKYYEPAEILVADPPDDFEDIVFKLGFFVDDMVELSELSTIVYNVRTPFGMKVPNALKLLKSTFPGLITATNQEYELQGDTATYTSRN